MSGQTCPDCGAPARAQQTLCARCGAPVDLAAYRAQQRERVALIVGCLAVTAVAIAVTAWAALG